MRMLQKPPPGWYYVILLVITAVSRAYANGCPEDVRYSTESCFSRYDNQLNNLETSSSNFYSGVNVEVIRSLCSTLSGAYGCADAIRGECPDTEYSDIETVLSDKESVVKLCLYDNLYEVYAPQEWCFHQQKAESEKCENQYRASVHTLDIRVVQGDEHAQQEMCGHFRTLVQCISTRIRVNCGAEAAKLVESLVRPSIGLSQYCRNDSLSATTAAPTTRGARAEPASHDQAQDQSHTGTTSSQHTAYLYLTLLPTLLIVYSLRTH